MAQLAHFFQGWPRRPTSFRHSPVGRFRSEMAQLVLFFSEMAPLGDFVQRWPGWPMSFRDGPIGPFFSGMAPLGDFVQRWPGWPISFRDGPIGPFLRGWPRSPIRGDIDTRNSAVFRGVPTVLSELKLWPGFRGVCGCLLLPLSRWGSLGLVAANWG